MKYKNKFWKYFAVGVIAGVFVLLSLFTFAQKAHAQSGASLWKLSSNTLSPVNSAWTLTVPGLNSTGSTRCLQITSAGLIQVASSACGGGGGGGHTIQEEGSDLTARTYLNFIGPTVTATDNSGADSTDVTIDDDLANYDNTTSGFLSGLIDLGDASQVEFTTGVADSNNNIPFRDSDGSLSTLADGVFYTDSGKVYIRDVNWFFKDASLGLFTFDGTELPDGETVTAQLADYSGSGAAYAGFLPLIDNSGTPTTDNCVKWITGFLIGDAGAPCGSGGGSIDGSGTTNEITYWVDSDTLGALAVATYPSLTELSRVKGVTSAIQTQLDAKTPSTRTITVAGTANEITSSAGAQDLSANRTWTLSLPSALTFSGKTVTGGTFSAPTITSPVINTGISGTAIASSSTINTGTSTSTIVTPDAFAASIFGVKEETISVFDPGYLLTTGDAKASWGIPSSLNGMNLISFACNVFTKSTSGTPTITLERGRQSSPTSDYTWVDVLSTALTIDANEYDSKDATTPAVINTSNDDVATGDQYRVNLDSAGTGTRGLGCRSQYQLP